jgi:hypothetical protein
MMGSRLRIGDAIRLALREFADPACRRCRGRGYRGELREDSLCPCVSRSGVPASRAIEAVVERARLLRAADVLEHVPDTWS